jgi:hypothetical protein
MLPSDRFQQLMSELQIMAAKSAGTAKAMDASVLDKLANMAADKIESQGYKGLSNALGQSKKTVALSIPETDETLKLGKVLNEVKNNKFVEAEDSIESYLKSRNPGKEFTKDTMGKNSNRISGDFSRNMESQFVVNKPNEEILQRLGIDNIEKYKVGHALKKISGYEKDVAGGKGLDEDIIKNILSQLFKEGGQ